MCVQVSGRSTGASALALQDPRASGVDPQAAGTDHNSFMMWQQYQQFLSFQNTQNQNQNRRQNNINITYTKSQRKAFPPVEPEKSPPSAAGGTPRNTFEVDSQEVLEEPAGEETPPTLPSRSSPPLNQVDPKWTPQEGQSGDRGLPGTGSVVVYDPAKASKRVLEALAERTVKRKAEKDEEQKKEEERKKKEEEEEQKRKEDQRKKKEEEEQKRKEDQRKKKKVPPSKTESKAKQQTKKTEAGESGAKAKAKAKSKAKAKAKSSKGNADEKEDEPAEETTEVKQEDPETTGDESRRQYTRKWYNARHKMGIVKLPANKQLCQFGNASVEKEKLVAIDKLISGSLQETGLKLWCEEELAKCAA